MLRKLAAGSRLACHDTACDESDNPLPLMHEWPLHSVSTQTLAAGPCPDTGDLDRGLGLGGAFLRRGHVGQAIAGDFQGWMHCCAQGIKHVSDESSGPRVIC